jgi:hypothetical protein
MVGSPIWTVPTWMRSWSTARIRNRTRTSCHQQDAHKPESGASFVVGAGLDDHLRSDNNERDCQDKPQYVVRDACDGIAPD